MTGRFHPVPVKTDPSSEEFLNDHVLARQPVVIKGALENWNARHWSPQYLAAKAGAREVSYRTENGDQTGAFGELVDRIFRGASDAPYLRNINIVEQLPELAADIRPEPDYSTGNWRSHVLMPRQWPKAVKKGAFELFVSKADAAFPYLHIDYWGMSGFFAQICGEKEVILFPPEDAENLYPTERDRLVSSIRNFDEPDYDRYPKLRAARQHRVRIGPGDLLYNPGWWHTTKTLKTAITIIWAYWNRHEWRHLLAEVRKTGGVRGRVFSTYFQFVGLCNLIAGAMVNGGA